MPTNFPKNQTLSPGGFPCQDISNAGRRVGIKGERSGLWSEFNRLICDIRPRFVFVENVSALLARGLGRVLGDLAAGGFDAEWDCIPAAAVGAPHIRDRIFICAYPVGSGLRVFGRAPAFSEAGGMQEAEREREWVRPDVESMGEGANVADAAVLFCDGSDDYPGSSSESARAVSEPRDGYRHAGAGSDWWATEPAVGRVANGVPARVDRLRGLGNAVVPQIAEWIGRRIVDADGLKP